ncbi:MAG: hypothetical protein K8S99_10640 [Planctomycetes bacterium]|nr:hypothetical protein [Planctomycetota bacterium]
MNDINFLPLTYVRVQTRHRRVYREAILVALTMVSIGGWYASSRGSLSEVEAYAGTLDNQASVLREQVTQVIKLDGERKSLESKVELRRQLEAPLETTTIVSTVGRLMPQSIALRSLSLEGQRPTPGAPASRSAGRGGAQEDRPAQAAPTPPETLSIVLIGLAPTDSAVTGFVGRLSSHGLFERVKLLYSRSLRVGDVIAREFRIEMEVPFDRQYTPNAQTQGVANAD